jgi:hypothetical protein
MEQSSSWEANWFSVTQEISRIVWNLKVHYHIHKRLPPVPIKVCCNFTIMLGHILLIPPQPCWTPGICNIFPIYHTVLTSPAWTFTYLADWKHISEVSDFHVAKQSEPRSRSGFMTYTARAWENLILHYTKCLNKLGDIVEKWSTGVHTFFSGMWCHYWCMVGLVGVKCLCVLILQGVILSLYRFIASNVLKCILLLLDIPHWRSSWLNDFLCSTTCSGTSLLNFFLQWQAL